MTDFLRDCKTNCITALSWQKLGLSYDITGDPKKNGLIAIDA